MWLVCVQMIISSSKSNHKSNFICIFLYSITTQTLSEKKTPYTEDIQTINKQTQKFCFYFLSFRRRIGMPNPAVIFYGD